MIDDGSGPGLVAPVRTGPVRRAVPHLGPRWGPVLGEISGLLLDVRAFGFRDAVRAWGRLGAAIRSAAPHADLGFVTVDAADVDTLGRAARALGASLLPGGDPDLAAALARSAAAVGRDPQDLLVQMARVHGVLDLDLGDDGEVPRDGGGAPAAHRIATRVHRMWRGGERGPR